MSAKSNTFESNFENSIPRLRWIALAFLLLCIFALAPLVVPEIFSPLVLVTLLVMTVSLWMMHRLIGLFNLKQLTIPGAFYFFYLSVIVVPGFFVFAEELSSVRNRYLFAIESALLTVPMGILIANYLFRSGKHETANFFSQPTRVETLGASSLRLYALFLGLGVLLAIMYLVETPVVPLSYLLWNPGDYLEIALLREDSFKLLNSPLVYAYYVLRETVFPFLIILSFGRYRQRREKSWRILFWISLSAGVIYAALTVEKLPVALIFGLILTFSYLFNGGRLSRKVMLAAPVLFLAFPLLVIILAFSGIPGATLWGAVLAIAGRIFSSPAEVLYWYFEVFPRVLPYQHGGTITKLAELMGWKIYDIPNIVGIDLTGQVSTVSANSCFLGNLNADFGLPGVVLGGLIAGFLMQAVHVYLCRKPKTVVNLAAYAICMWAFALISVGPLPTALLSGGVCFALILSWIFKSPDRKLSCPDSNPLAAHTWIPLR